MPDRFRFGPASLTASPRRPSRHAVPAGLACAAALISAVSATGLPASSSPAKGTPAISGPAIPAAAHSILAHEQRDGAIRAGGAAGPQMVRPYVANVAETGGSGPGAPARPSHRNLAESDLPLKVNEAIGTTGGGNTSEAATAPFGMLELGPQLPDPYDTNFAPGEPIAGLSLTNVDGVGCPLFGDVPILPVSGPVGPHPGSLTSPFTTDSTEPGSWAGTVGAVAVSAAATTRTAIAALRFRPGAEANLVVKAGDSDNGNTGAFVKVASPTEVIGSASSSGFCGNPAHYRLYFVIRSSIPFSTERTYRASGHGAGTVVSYGAGPARLGVIIKVGISYVSVADAAANIAAEDPSWSVAAIRAATAAEWARLLSRVQVRGSAPKVALFYSALYHSLLAPETFSDANGRYLGFDGRVHELPAGDVQFSEFSGWDIQVSEFPLLCLVVPRTAAEMAQSLVRDEEQGGWLPRWPVAASYTGVMEGDPADLILAEAVAFGCTDGLDVAAAARAAVKGAILAQTPSDLGQGTYWERYFGPQFNDYGFAPGQASETLQFSMDDYGAARLASAAGLSAEANRLLAYSDNWRNTFDPRVRLPEPRNAPSPGEDGSFASSAGVAPSGQDNQPGFDEGNASQYRWLVPEHLAQLTGALGGDRAAAAKLSAFLGPMMERGLDADAQQPYYEASNEPDLWAPWEADFFGDPALTERATSSAESRFYNRSTNGLPGNDDAGELSSWDIWAMIGLFPMIPGTATMAIGSPELSSVSIRAGARALTISATDGGSGGGGLSDAGNSTDGGGPDLYVRATSLDGRAPIGRPSFTLPLAGATSLRFEMGPHPTPGAFTTRALIVHGSAAR